MKGHPKLGFAMKMLGTSSKHIIPNGGESHGDLPWDPNP